MHRKTAAAILVLLFCGGNANAQLIVAHRGASFDAPENTLAAFRLAWEQQADAIEGDFYVTKDNQIVCIHDKTTKRVAPMQIERPVNGTTLQELQSYDVGSWKHPRYKGERIPTLMEVLRTVPPGKQIFVEIKCGTEILPILETQLKASGLARDQIVIICFNKDVVTASRQRMPQYKANWLTSYKQENKASDWTPDRDEIVRVLGTTKATGLGSNGNLKAIDQNLVDAVRRSSCEFHVWTVNDAEHARLFQAMAVDSITTDRPAYLRNVLGNKATTVTR